MEQLLQINRKQYIGKNKTKVARNKYAKCNENFEGIEKYQNTETGRDKNETVKIWRRQIYAKNWGRRQYFIRME